MLHALNIVCLIFISQSLLAQESADAAANSPPSLPSPITDVEEEEEEEEKEEKQGFLPVILYDGEGMALDPCAKFDAQYESWLDRSRVGIYKTVCGSAAWFDGFFGDSRFDEKTGDTYGRLSLGGFYDRRDSFDERMRFRAKFAFPAMRSRGAVFVEQGDAESVIKGGGTDSAQQAPETLTSSSDTDLYAGFGFDKSRNLERGVSLRFGVKLRSGLDTFVKARYRYAWRVTDDTLLRISPLVYWEAEERFGGTLGLEMDNYLNDNMLLRWANFGNVSQDRDINGMRWGSTFSLFQALSNRRAMTYTAFVRGETEDAVKLQDYGVETKFRHRFLREWLFLEYVGSVSWPKELPGEDREINPGFGVRFELHFGPTPPDELR